MLGLNASTNNMSPADIKELARLRHEQELELIRAKSEAKIEEIYAQADAEIRVSSYKAKLTSDLFEKKAEVDTAIESHKTHEFGKRLRLLQEHESFKTDLFERRMGIQQDHESFMTKEQEKRIKAEKDAQQELKTYSTNEALRFQIGTAQAKSYYYAQDRQTDVKANRAMLLDSLRHQHMSNLLNSSSNQIQIEELPDSDQSDTETALVVKK